MKSRKLILALVFMLVAVTILSACGKEKAADTTAAPDATKAPVAADGKKLYIPVISKGFQHQFWQAVKAGAEKAAKEFDVEITFEGPETEQQVDKQLEIFQAALDKNPAAIAFAALDSKAADALLKKAKERNIPIIGFDSGVDSDIPVATAATDNLKAASVAADEMAKLINNEGEIAVIQHDNASRTGIDRAAGFVNQIKTKYPNIKIVDTQVAGDILKAADAAKAIIAAHPNLKGMFGTNEGAANGVVTAVAELKTDKLVIIGFDSGKLQMDAIRSGKMAGAITQNPVGIGYESVKAAVQAVKGEKVEKNIDTGFYYYTKENIDTADIQAVLYN